MSRARFHNLYLNVNSVSRKLVVQWYDVGQDALEGLKGVKKVEKGFRGTREINTVYYDSDLVTIEEMEAALKAAGTYIGVEK